MSDEMETILQLRQMIQRKQKHYKLAVGDHLVTLHKALDQDVQKKLQNLSQRSIAISVPGGNENKIINGFSVANLPESRVDERIIIVQQGAKKLVAEGSIVNVDNREVKIKLDKPFTIIKKDENETTCSEVSVFMVKFDKQNILSRKRRIENALLKFRSVSCSLPLHKSLLGSYKDWSNTKFGKARAISLNDSLKLKGSQMKAVEESMKKRISLIEGVAGSGKTLVAASLAYSMHRYRNKKILLCSPIQSTVDKLAQMLYDTKRVSVVKLSQKRKSSKSWRSKNNCSSEESSSQELGDCCLNSLIKSEIFKRGWQRAERTSPFPKGSNRHRVLLHKQANRVVSNSSSWLKKEVERKILRKADIICCTLVQAGSPCLRGLNFDMLIIDDLQAASEPDCMIPMMMKGLKQVTLISEMRREIRSARSKRQSIVGKQEPNGKSLLMKANGLQAAKVRKQAGDLVVKQAQEPGGLFERLLSMGLTAVALRNQFRMHETLAAFSNHHFYLSRLKTDKEANQELTRRICSGVELGDDRFNWLPNNRCLTAFFDIQGYDGSIDDIVRNIINKLVSRENVHKSRIGIIVTSERLKTSSSFDGIDVGTVENFQGQERDFIILLAHGTNDAKINLDKSSTTTDCNYLRDEDALLIAITRARLGQFIIAELGDIETSGSLISTSSQDERAAFNFGNYNMNYCDSWKALVKYYLVNKLVIHTPWIGME